MDVGPSDGSQEPKLTLLSACRLSTNWEYVALSHCWGQSQLYRIHSDDIRIDLETWMEDQKNLADIKKKKTTNNYLRDTRTTIAANSNVNFA
jgi:phosphorylcholine metabolism protein LicD